MFSLNQIRTPKFLYCLRNYRVKNQILVIQLLIFTVIIAFLTIALVINRVIIESVIEKVSLQLLQNINQKALHKQSTYLEYQTFLTFNFGFGLLNKINNENLYLLKQQNIMLGNTPFSCVDYNVRDIQPFQYYLPQLCYYYANHIDFALIPKTEIDQHLIVLIQMLNQQLLLIGYSELEPTIYLTQQGDGQFFAIIPQKMRYPMYRPKERQWYKDHIAALNNSNQPEVISEIYRNYETQEFEFTLTVSLTDSELEFDGVIALDSNFQVIKPKINYDQLNIYLVDLDGRILISNVYPNINFVQELKFFNDTSITGFDNEDWNEVLNQILNQKGQSNCQFDYKNFCRYNKLFEQDLFIRGFGIHNRFYQIVFVDYKFMEQNDNDTQQLKSELLSQATAQLFYYSIYNISGILLCWIIMHFFLKPYYELTRLFQQTTQTKFNQKYEIALRKVKLFKQNNLIQTGLDNLCNTLSKIRSKKSRECHYLENYKYPKNLAKNAYKFRYYIKQFPK
ncbi:unnamed protein product (macronuclear) [Paramecium tetraurelia]|uniref:Cache domain-containing protein n=1 Tax=Paramecium tetraurelia TaxID=5888 RepID=A0D5I5_PARTE|nr:uncharacterized protein GSPATT00013732001 [Paramecium tetraurelia]CAK78302.1 unnamed protein product [Paramecium tetraurelia]|eukprot:XP_001445699.1 hypothetical protein (macronuclear) [Paramecium tetraurelia strain d4-2]